MEQNWAVLLINQINQQIQDYPTRALLNQTLSLIEEQEKRIEQLEGEIDGRLWNHTNW